MQESENGIVRVRRTQLSPVEVESARVSVNATAEAAKANLLDIVWRRRWTVLAAVVLALVAATVFLYRATPIYQSSSRLFVQKSGPQILNENQGAGVASNTYLATQCELIRSTPILAMAAESPSLSGLKAERKVDNAVGYLRSELDAVVGKNNEIITISFQSPDPEEAARVVNSVVDAYVTYQSTQKRSTAAEVLKILQKEKDKRDAELSDLLKAMLEFKRQHAALSFEGSKGNVVTERLSALSDALTQAQLAMIESKAALQAAETIKNDPARLRQTVSGALIAAVDRRRSDLSDRIYALQTEMSRDRNFGIADGHRLAKVAALDMARLQAELVDETNVANRHLAELYLATLVQEHQKTAYRVAELQKAFDEQRESAVNLNVQAAEYSKLYSELQRTERLCEILDTRIKELNVTEDVGAMNISILEVGRPNRNAVFPQKPRTLGMALVIGVVLGLGVAMLQDLRDQRLRSADEIQALLGIQVLGIIPHMQTENSLGERGQKVHKEPTSEIAEAYRTVRTAIYFGVPDSNMKKLLITSPAPGDGKSTSASNIATTMAMAGQRTLIVDCDFRRPTQHKIFDSQNNLGLSSVIVGKSDLTSSIQKTPIPNLSLLPCGPIPPNPSELLNSQTFADVLDKLGEEFDHIVIDSPPVMAVADARIIAASVDLTVLVLRAEKSTRKASEYALESLVGVGGNVLGVVVNDVPRGRGSYGYYGKYGYYSYAYGTHHESNDRKSCLKSDNAITDSDGGRAA